MSNHDGSYMLNTVLFLLKEQNVFDYLGKEKTLKFLNRIRDIGWDNDCNNGEILDKIGEQLGVCYTCWEYGGNLEYGICEKCREGFHVK